MALLGGVEALLLESGSQLTCSPLSGDAARVLTGWSFSHVAIPWDAASGEVLQVYGGHKFDLARCAFSPDGNRVLTSSEDESLMLWDVATDRVVQIDKHKSSVDACAFSPEGDKILTCSGGKACCGMWLPGRRFRSIGDIGRTTPSVLASVRTAARWSLPLRTRRSFGMRLRRNCCRSTRGTRTPSSVVLSALMAGGY
jgi:WD40 repeat protein